jgi:hypothetical protein
MAASDMQLFFPPPRHHATALDGDFVKQYGYCWNNIGVLGNNADQAKGKKSENRSRDVWHRQQVDDIIDVMVDWPGNPKCRNSSKLETCSKAEQPKDGLTASTFFLLSFIMNDDTTSHDTKMMIHRPSSLQTSAKNIIFC